MKEGKKGLYVVFSGHICTGKDSIIDVLKIRGELDKLVSQDAKVHFLSEVVNHDKEVLDGYYGNMADTTEFFEIGTLCYRSILSSAIKHMRGIIIANRHVIEARQTFVENSRLMHDDGKKYFDETATGMYDMMLRRAMEKGVVPIPDIVFFLFVDDPQILVERNLKRGDPGEKAIKAEYIKQLNPFFERYRKKFNEIYEFWGVRPPKLVEINTSHDMETNEQFMQMLAKRVEEEIAKSYSDLPKGLFDYSM
tara:strand:+ start:824 stop:1576 length:753 start_codon:yes stop_codon:yes gene_type:complete